MSSLCPIFIDSVHRIAKKLKKHKNVKRCLQNLVVMRIPLELLEELELKQIVEHFKEKEEFGFLAQMALQKFAMAEKTAEVEKNKDSSVVEKTPVPSTKTGVMSPKKEVKHPESAKTRVSKRPLAPGYKISEAKRIQPSSSFRIPKKSTNGSAPPMSLMSLNVPIPRKYQNEDVRNRIVQWIVEIGT